MQLPPADILQSELDYAISIQNRIAALTEKVELLKLTFLLAAVLERGWSRGLISRT